MSNHNENEPNRTAQAKLTRQKMEASGYDPDNPAHLARYQRGRSLVEANRWNETEFKRDMDRVLEEQRDKVHRDAARGRAVELGLMQAEPKRDEVSRNGSGIGNWRDRLRQSFPSQAPQLDRLSPEAQRSQVRESHPQARLEGPAQDKKQIEVDWRRAQTDPAYRRETREMRQSEQKERSGEQRSVPGPQHSPSR